MKATTRLWAITNSIVQTDVPDSAEAALLRFVIGLANAVYHTALATNAPTAATTSAKKFMPCMSSPSVRVGSASSRYLRVGLSPFPEPHRFILPLSSPRRTSPLGRADRRGDR